MPSVDALVLFFITALVVIISPGPSNLYVMARSVAQGVRGGAVASTGLAAGGMVHVVAGALGLSIIVQHLPVLYSLMKIAGAVYLIWLGITQIMATRNTPARLDAPDPVAHRSDRRILMESVMVEAPNPKVALFFLAFLPQFVDTAQGAFALQFAVFGVIFVVVAFLCDLVYALAAGRAANLMRTSRTARQIQDWVSGSALIGLGGYMAFSARD